MPRGLFKEGIRPTGLFLDVDAQDRCPMGEPRVRRICKCCPVPFVEGKRKRAEATQQEKRRLEGQGGSDTKSEDFEKQWY